MPKKLTIVVSSIQAVGHVTACAGALSGVFARGHRVIFLLTKLFEGKLAKLGYEEHIFPAQNEQYNSKKVNPAVVIAEIFQRNKIIGPYPPIEKMRNLYKLSDNPRSFENVKIYDEQLRNVIELYKPDLFYIDGFLPPAVHYSGIPWIRNISPQPLLFMIDENLPPGGSGLPVDGDRSEWTEWNELRKEALFPKGYNDLLKEMGYPPYSDNKYPETQILNVYGIAEEMNYPQISASDWFNLEVFNVRDTTNDNESLEKIVPKEFLNNDLGGNFSGKLIYLSMGSMGSVDLELMNRLVGILAKTDHKYIISTGPRHDEYELTGKNMWGSEFLPQTQIVLHVDLVITHGGNNTVTEVFAEGKPMIVLPLFGDQYDNAQRLKETGLGARIDPYDFTESELVDTIEKMLNDKELQEKLKKASERIRSTNHHLELAIKIEQLTEKLQKL